MRALRRAVISVVSLSIVVMAGAASATPFLALDITGGSGVNSSTPPETRGWRFSLGQPQLVLSLGFWDLFGDGFDASHDVSLWTDAGVLVATATVTSSSTLVSSTQPFGDWRFEDLSSPVSLAAGTYRIGAVTNATDTWILNGTPTTAPDVTFLGGVYAGGIGFPGPSADIGFGPNLILTPEPSTSLLLAGGLLGLAVGQRRRKT